MKIQNHTFQIELSWEYEKQGKWIQISDEEMNKDSQRIFYFKIINQDEETGEISYKMGFDTTKGNIQSEMQTKLRMNVALIGEKDIYHLIPCNIYGNNNAELANKNEFPLLTEGYQDSPYCARRWEYRADRAATPVSAICCERGCVGVTITPYAEADCGKKEIHNGLFATLPNICGCSVGYTNDPVTFTNKRTLTPSTGDTAFQAEVTGKIYCLLNTDSALDKTGEQGRVAIHELIRREYDAIHVRPVYQKTFREAVKGCLDSFVQISWNRKDEEYTNCHCLPPADNQLKPWRNVVEIGWTGGGVLAYPLILAEKILGEEGRACIRKARTGYEMIDRIIASYNEKSGLLNDLTRPIDDSKSLVNGWWAGFGLTQNCHCSYNVGSAVHYILKSICFLKEQGMQYPEDWLTVCEKVLDTVITLQREDGAFGYTYATDEKKVLDWDGFAGCWFVPCCAYLYHLTSEERYLTAADKGMSFYKQSVLQINCSGTPMDTWKSVDEEGNLAFIRGSRLLHEYTGKDEYLHDLELGANYEFLWRYAYPTHPDYRPIKTGWNACGGSVTSVSNPHIHPMGMIVDTDLYYLGKQTADEYYTDRALDGTAWIMQTLELYPEQTGYGQYGVLSERWCPSDGLTIQRDSNDEPYSSWFSYNLWAAAAAFEEVCERELYK